MAKNPVNRDTVKKLIDTLTPMNPETAEKFVQDLLRIADERRRDLERVVGDVTKVGVRTAEGVASSIQQEWSRQLSRMAARIDDLERQVDSLGHALETTRANLVSLAERSAGKSGEVVQDSMSASKKSAKTRKKAEKKSVKKSVKKADKNSANPAESVVESDDSAPPAVAGI